MKFSIENFKIIKHARRGTRDIKKIYIFDYKKKNTSHLSQQRNF